MPPRSYHVIVIGGGHAGVEAAWAAANLLPAEPGRPSVALITLDPSKIGVMSCNPAIGGLAKGQLVREIDALGGLMGLATDATGIQFKVLNTSKGQAVHGPRAQCDKHAYADTVQALIASRPEIEVIAGSVEEFIIEDGRIRGVAIKANGQIANGQMAHDAAPQSATPSSPPAPAHQHLPFAISAPAVVLTTGTFMRGLMHTGEARTPGGRHGEAAAEGISGALRRLGFELGRLKTGTPPRLKRSTIDWDNLPAQRGDDPPVPFSDLSASGPDAQCLLPNAASSPPAFVPPCLRAFPTLPQVECRQTHTTAAVHDLIRANLHRAPMYSGQIESTGPRYCPSIEDKVVRFADRPTHGVFLEPESLRDDWIYCNGISTSLPADIQDRIVRSMPGCEHAEIYRYGYAVEYDMVRPHQIHATGETKRIAGLFLAGQINGTSGYEEAAAQGFIAGLNAARRALRQDPVTLGRDEAYLGVLMDDLVTKTPVEPYRMFTSRAEHRLLLRADNAADRLTPRAIEWGLLDSTELGRARRRLFDDRQRQIRELNAAIDRIRVEGQPLAKLLRTPDFTSDDLARAIVTSNPSTEAPTDAASEPILAREQDRAEIGSPPPREQDGAEIGPPLPREQDRAEIGSPLPREQDRAEIGSPLPREQDRAEIGPPLPREQDRAEIGPPLPRERERAGVRASSTTHASPASTSSASSYSSSSSSSSSSPSSTSPSPSPFSSSSPAPRPEGERLLPGASAPGEARHLSSFSFKPPPPGGRTSQFSPSVLSTVFAERRYEAYIARQHAEIKRHAEIEHRRLPDDIDYNDLTSLRTEARTALSKFRPETFGQAGRLEGITPADLTLLAVLVQKHRRRATDQPSSAGFHPVAGPTEPRASASGPSPHAAVPRPSGSGHGPSPIGRI